MYSDMVLKRLREWHDNDPTCPSLVGEAVDALELLRGGVEYLECEVTRLDDALFLANVEHRDY